ncbi:hypothetical protein KBX06_24525 [Micromonospora sp. C31]|uniref:membrane protein YczE n=1 Tax=Micromonospora sp. C31 TaxID=2824876 RepID=UPI001B374C83|nr:hypothetical protein [Micromonospora sp. C31]MBQ1076298.1 hypothetical protein [Micromonospora sp. C31]
MSTRLPGRMVRLLGGLVLFGVSVALMVRADLGLASWDVLHQGLAERTGVPLGQVVNLVAVAVLLLWIPLRQRPGFGTLANAVVVGVTADAALALLPSVTPLSARIGLLVAGILLNGLATALYLGAGLGPGPRDGLMTGLAARGVPIGRVRTAIELGVLALGWTLGGTVGPGTLLFAVSIGPLAHHLIPKFTVPTPSRPVTTGATPPCPA